ncbi:MAG: zf-HC2 domain-containing protein [Thermoguttaceae bacterium]|nr:zf-HC2 domain-containing protein [Thermoguttaceae bacterium]
MEKRNQEYCKADAIAGLAVLANSGTDCVSDDYGLLESLASDTLSPNEARRFAEHLKTCEACRQECAAMWATGLYDDSPFGDRMRAFEKDPISETDANWKTIAVAFNEDLASAAKRSVVSLDESVADDLYVAPEFKQTLAVWEASKARARSKATPRRAVDKWRALSYSAAAVLLGLVVAQFLETKPPVNPDCRNRIAMHTEDETARPRSIGVVPEYAPSKGGSREASDGNGEDAAPTFQVIPRGGPAAKGVAGGPAAKGVASNREQHECVQTSDANFAAFAGAAEINREGVAAFNDGDFMTASQKFGKLVALLNGKPKLVEGEEGDLKAALFDAYWNYGVATAKKDKEHAAYIFEELKTKNLVPDDDRQRKYFDAALEAWKE